jgi:gas vesicle protein
MEELKKMIKDLGAEMAKGFEATEEGFAMIGKQISKVMDDVKELKDDVRELKEDKSMEARLTRRIELLEERVHEMSQ